MADPRKRADLFEVARHSWLSDFAHVVAQVTSSTTTVGEIANATVTAGMYLLMGILAAPARSKLTPPIDAKDAPGLVRSHSVREPAKAVPSNMSPVGGLSHQGKIDPSQTSDKTETPRDPKRRTVQVEYVAPQRQTTRGEALPNLSSLGNDASPTITPAGPSKSRARAGTEIPEAISRQYPSNTKPLPQDPRYKTEKAYQTQSSANRNSQRPTSSQRDMAPPARPPKDFPRSVSDSTSAFGQAATSTGRPTTGGSMTSIGRLPSRGNSYSQPLAPTVAATNAQGRVTQPKTENRYNISAPMPIPEPYIESDSVGRPSTQHYGAPPTLAGQRDPSRTHKRSNTLGNFFRTGSISGPPRSQPPSPAETPQREKKYPPTSMKNPIPSDNTPRQSMESRRPSFSFSRKSRENSDVSKPEKPRRFSLLPASFSFKNFTGTAVSKDGSSDYRPASERRQSNAQNQVPAAGVSSRPQTVSYQKSQSNNPHYRQESENMNDYDGQREDMRTGSAPQPRRNDYASRGPSQPQQSQYGEARYPNQEDELRPAKLQPFKQSYVAAAPSESEISLQNRQYRPVYPPGFGSEDQDDKPRKSTQQSRPARGPAVLTKNNRRFADAYDQVQEPGSGSGHHAGSSGAAKRVMDFFRRRGKARAGDDRV